MRNSQGGQLEVITIRKGEYQGQQLLQIHDDPSEGGTIAVHLLDKKTKDYLISQILGDGYVEMLQLFERCKSAVRRGDFVTESGESEIPFRLGNHDHSLMYDLDVHAGKYQDG